MPWVQWLPSVLLFAHQCGSKAKLTSALTVSLVLRVILGSTKWGKAVKHHSTLALHGNIVFQIPWAALLQDLPAIHIACVL